MADPPAKRRKTALTALAEKYGHPTGSNDDIIQGYVPLKSGLTPLNPGPFRTVAEKVLYEKMVEYQRRRLKGFTINQLVVADAFAPYLTGPVASIPDSYPIHPLYARDRWAKGPIRFRHLAKYPLGNGRSGYWEASNDMVWDAIAPALRLASLFLTNANFSSWWNALFTGTYTMITLEEKRRLGNEFDMNNYVRFRTRTGVETQEGRDRLRQEFTDLSKVVILSFRSGRATPESGLPNPKNPLNYYLGTTHSPYIYQTPATLVRLNFELLEPLMSMKLNPTERALEIFRIAAVLMHESAHAAWAARVHRRMPTVSEEPYFEDEVISELGFSLENALFGGIPAPVCANSSQVANEHSYPAGGVLTHDWNKISHESYSTDKPVLTPLPKDWHTYTWAAIPAAFYCDFQHKDFWEGYVRKFGSRSTHVQQHAAVGADFTYGDTFENGYVSRKTYNFHYGWDHFKDLPIDPTMPLDEQNAIRFENERLRRGRRIAYSIDEYRKRMDAIAATNEKNQATLPYQAFSSKEPLEAPSQASCERFDEIRNFLLKNRLGLALDTMDFPMPEHTLYAYILAQGGLSLTADEWRAFLRVCHDTRNLFSHQDCGIVEGIITGIEKGWPKSALPRRKGPLWGRPNSRIMAVFRKCVELVVTEHSDVFLDGFMDHDKENMRLRVNGQYKFECGLDPRNRVVNRFGKTITEFGVSLFDACVHYCGVDHQCLTWGPEGVVRRVSNPNDKKRKRVDQGDQCNPM